jgi:hypothetical protein
VESLPCATPQYELHAGLVVWTNPIEQIRHSDASYHVDYMKKTGLNPVIMGGPLLLSEEAFCAEGMGESITVRYNGVLGVLSPSSAGDNTPWLRFEVALRKSRPKVLTIVTKVYAFLEQEKCAAEVVECFAPLTESQSERMR